MIKPYWMDVPILAENTAVISLQWGKGFVLPRPTFLPDWMTLVKFKEDPTEDGRMAVFTEFIRYQ